MVSGAEPAPCLRHVGQGTSIAGKRLSTNGGHQNP